MLAIRGTRLFDGERPAKLASPTVVIADGRILDVRPGDSASAVLADNTPSRATSADLGDVTLMPGLVDTHVHLGFDAGPDPIGRLASVSADEALDMMRAAARTTLAAGITTVRDLGDRDYLALRLRDELAQRPSEGPQVLAAGPPITTTRGHCGALGGKADGVDGIKAAVREHAERGVDVIKVMASGGVMTEGTRSELPQYGLHELRAAAEEAHRLGLPITAHAHAGQAIADVLAAGFDSIEHCSFMTADGVEPHAETIAAIAAAGVAVSATLGMLPDPTLPPAIATRINAIIDLLRSMTLAGVTIVCGSDAGIGPPKPHGVLPHAVRQFVDELGWPPAEALGAVTSRAARVCGLGDRKGRIAPGFDADIIAVNGDPLRDPAAVLDVRAVFRMGQRCESVPAPVTPA
ncbi:amidohydrolase family protein [Phytoactinopolyspora endophytica]|uniref:amidohydrolase family protein n=1 Tax=Phytoactinopolyspora endophytica TaxID=1642495 RepID=UPI00101D8FB4|nr:amidohydrolase family protein [Phytoactinopolyspora endophytica]